MACFPPPQLLLLAIGFLLLCGVRAHCEDDSCVHYRVVRSTNTNLFPKRAIEVQLANRSDVAYYAQLNIGSPAQPVYVQLDTGSFELWVNPQCQGLGFADAAFCESIGFYNVSASTTAQPLNTGKTLAYGIGEAQIAYVKDSISLPGATSTMSDVQFGVAVASKDEFSGILGIGYGKGLTTNYPNFVDELALQNQTSVKAFSVGLGSKREEEGAICFGGVDTSKFAGALATLPIVPAKQSPDGVPRYWVSMNSLSLTPPNGVSKTYANTSMDVFFDTGATLTLLPPALANAIGKDFGASGADSNGYYSVDCRLADMNGTVDFAFNGVTIKVPYDEFIRESSSGAGMSCVLGIAASNSFTLLGDSFLRSAYAVFDLEQDAIHLQQYQNCGSTPAAITNASQLTGLRGECSGGSTVKSDVGTNPSDVGTNPSATGSATTATTTGSFASGSDATSSSSGGLGAGSTTGSDASGASSTLIRRDSPVALIVAMMVLLAII